MLPEDIVSRVRARVSSGEFADEAEVIAEGLRVLDAWDEDLDRWLRTDVVAAWEAHLENPSRAKTIDEVRAGLRDRQSKAVSQTA